MARKSKKKASSQVGSQPAVDAVVPAAEPEGMVRKSTCTVAVLAALLLGLYAGMVAPRFLDDGHSSAPQEAAHPAPQPEMPASTAPPIPQEMAQQISQVERSLLEEPGNAQLWTVLGNLYFDTNQPRKAISAYEKTLHIQPENADVLTDLGIMYREVNDFTKAVESFRKASTLEPRHENAIFNEGVVLYYDLQRRDEAFAVWQRLLQLNPQARTPDGKPVGEMLKMLREQGK